MKTLAFDTSTLATGVALVEDDRLLAEFILQGQLGHSEALIEMTEDIFKKLDLDLKEVDLISVGTGPGSFTGLRIAVTAAKILAQALSRPLIGLSSLAALAENLPLEGTLVPLLDARRNRVYRGVFKRGKEGLIRLEKDDALPLEDLVASLEDGPQLIFTGDGLGTYKDPLKEAFPQALFIEGANRGIRPSSLAFLGARLYKEGHRTNLYDLAPNYVRESQAMREYKKRMGQDG
ncbi:MAG: tRNA (adenosine(37)-N6)-threonylcarbamoyltransferase complex dimerization subunit type 1 TsaB [Tissierellia bacterium]|nr:tRNA (adenosine(37)-N6)-threonylcarbamoyltransferase complex dimerization subunit type 1 TsaB [Tissierellia bacterium]